MRRAIPFLALALTAGLATGAFAQQPIMNGIGLVDYSKKPNFKVGDWARYRMSSESQLGMKDDYVLTVVIAGEEDFWGDPAFWVETWVEMEGYPPQTRAALMSYEIFSDSSATDRLQLYMRKAIIQLNEDGTPRMEINKPAASTLRARHEVKNPVTTSKEYLGQDTVQTPKGTFETRMVLMKEGKGVSQDIGDSTMYTELREDRTSWYTDAIPITRLAREDIVTTSSRKTWLTGRSGDALAMNIRDKGIGSARLIDFGHGAEARILPKHLRRSIAEQQAAERAARAKPATGKTATRRQ